MKPSRILFLVFVLAFILVSPALANVNESNWTNSTATIYRFTHSNSSYYCTNWTPPAANLSVQYLIVGGGASGGEYYGAGGAGGGLLSGTIADLPGSPVTVCVAGAVPAPAYPGNGLHGLNSTFGSLTALGGGFGARGDTATTGGNGGCGGGGAKTGGSGSGTSGQGFDGGSSVETYSAGGGGSPAHQGYNSTGTDYSNAVGGNGADGKWSDIAGIWQQFGPGGGGYGYMTGGTGGSGGGGHGGQSDSPPYAATNGTYANGGGGGGDSNYVANSYAGAGGSGVIYLRYTAATYNPPPSIANLANSSTTCNSTVISWTNPGDLSNFNHTAFWRNSVAHYNASNTTTTFTDTGLSEHTWYNYSSRTTNMAGAMNTSFVNVSVFTQSCMGTITAAFSCAPLAGNAPGFNTTCTDASTGSPTSWYWVFGDGNTSTLQNPTTTYNWAGLFNVSLYASKPGADDWENKTAYINVTWAGNVTPVPMYPSRGSAGSSVMPQDWLGPETVMMASLTSGIVGGIVGGLIVWGRKSPPS